jgi:hypothetical protein
VRKPKVTKIKMTFPTLGQEIGIKDNNKKKKQKSKSFFSLSLSLLIVMIISTPGGYK